ncbi:hypothetical protein [Cyclobacterium plantarum]|uniref:Lipoprotein n=1 Tax=Cyclobacterium plantarum TaxID=2716263 RepID=A0ABX0H7I2_9BACT|nr:hypothetical protein [Cyclobacterium plantarum]NHE57816.1 hypothetical protein [Cyclobacterium plantarum]
MVTDSIQVDYQGNLFLYDYDSSTHLFLGMDNRTDEVLLFDRQGTVSSRFHLAKDGPNAISWAVGWGFFKGQFTVMDAAKGLLFFSREGEIVKRMDLNPPYTFINGLKSPVHAFGKELAYIRPERGEMDWNEPSEMFESIYRSPILELVDPETGANRQTMPFPPGTIYEDGNFYHWTFPTVIPAGEEWLVYFRGELAYHVYTQAGGELDYQETIDLDLKDAVAIKGVPMANIDNYYEASLYNVFGRIQNLFVLDSQILIHYTKGMEEEKAKTLPRNTMEESRAFLYQIKNYLAVLDRENRILQKDIPVPQGITLSSAVDEKGAIFGLKDQDYLGVEEDTVTFYQMKLLKEGSK